MTAGIYIIRNINDGKVYVGSAANISNRWSVHRRALNAGTHHSAKLQRAWAKHGWDAFAFEVVAIERDHEKRIALEQHFIDSNNAATRGYNIFPIAGSPSGYRHSDAAIAKISAANKGKKKPDGHGAKVSAARKGVAVSAREVARLAEIRPRKHTAESRARMSASQIGNTNRKGVKSSAETRARQSAALKGKPKSEEARRNIAAAVRRRFGKSDALSNNTEAT